MRELIRRGTTAIRPSTRTMSIERRCAAIDSS
jgi:hypothetical protein